MGWASLAQIETTDLKIQATIWKIVESALLWQAGYHSHVQFCILNIYLGNTQNLLLKTKHFS